MKIFAGVSAILYLVTFVLTWGQIWLFGELTVRTVPHSRVDILAAFLIIGMLLWWILADRKGFSLGKVGKDQGIRFGVQMTATFSAFLYLTAFIVTQVDVAIAGSLTIFPVVHATVDIVYMFIIVIMLGWWFLQGRRR